MQLITSEIHEGELMGQAALLKGPDQSILLDADVSTWTLEIFQHSHAESVDRRRPVYSVTVVPATLNVNTGLTGTPVILNTSLPPRNDDYWSGPEPGYNFLYFVTQAARDAHSPPFVPMPGHTYRMRFVFTTTGFDKLTLVHDVRILDV